MAAVLMYSTRVCPYCRMAEALLTRKGVQPQKVLVDEEPARRTEMVDRTGRKTVPQIYIGDRHVGGYAELAELDHQGELDELLAKP
jgi:glutaredoxin 3